jgi:hypothetical protein
MIPKNAVVVSTCSNVMHQQLQLVDGGQPKGCPVESAADAPAA